MPDSNRISIHLKINHLYGLVFSEMYGNEDGSIPATFHILYAIGWKPDPTQVRIVIGYWLGRHEYSSGSMHVMSTHILLEMSYTC